MPSFFAIISFFSLEVFWWKCQCWIPAALYVQWQNTEYPKVFLSFSRWRWRWWGVWWGETAVLFRLRHALSHRLLESSVCLRPSHWLLEWLGLFCGLYLHDWTAHCCHWWAQRRKTNKLYGQIKIVFLFITCIKICRTSVYANYKDRWWWCLLWYDHRWPGLSFWLHSWPEGLCHSGCICCIRNVCARWAFQPLL